MDYRSFDAIIRDKKPIHLCGIGGVSMRALARYLHNRGAVVRGSDRDESNETKKLEAMGIPVAIGHSEHNTDGAALVIRTAAVLDSNPDIVGARRDNIPVVERAEAWGLIMTRYPSAVCIAGTHGKTTTTSMVATFTQAAGYDPTVMVGGDLPSIGGTLRIGGGSLMVAEACEYKNSYHSFAPSVAVILNVDRDHLDFFSDTDDIIRSFRHFAELVPKDTGLVVVNRDDANAMAAVDGLERPVMTFGSTEAADVYCKNVRDVGGFYQADVWYRDSFYSRLRLSVPGRHNLMNALASAAVAIHLGTDPVAFETGMEAYHGVGRRFEYRGELNGARLFDDYSHHPSEIAAALKAAREMRPQRVICIFQPHTYSRTVSLLDDFAEALKAADVCILADIYAAREVNTWGVTTDQLAALIPGAEAIHSFAGIVERIRSMARPGDIILTMGAGDVTTLQDLLRR